VRHRPLAPVVNRRIVAAGALTGLVLGVTGVTGYFVGRDDPAEPTEAPQPSASASVVTAEPSESPSLTRAPSARPEPPAATTAGETATATRVPTRSPLPTRTSARPSPSSPSPSPPVRQTDPDVVPNYPNCEAMRADHPAGVDREHPAYRLWFDLDLDGYACEPE
jgi:hypothetical protein